MFMKHKEGISQLGCNNLISLLPKQCPHDETKLKQQIDLIICEMA